MPSTDLAEAVAEAVAAAGNTPAPVEAEYAAAVEQGAIREVKDEGHVAGVERGEEEPVWKWGWFGSDRQAGVALPSLAPQSLLTCLCDVCCLQRDNTGLRLTQLRLTQRHEGEADGRVRVCSWGSIGQDNA